MKIREVVVTGQNQVELQTPNIDAPVLGSNELLIDTEYTFISSGTELANYTGREPKFFRKVHGVSIRGVPAMQMLVSSVKSVRVSPVRHPVIGFLLMDGTPRRFSIHKTGWSHPSEKQWIRLLLLHPGWQVLQ